MAAVTTQHRQATRRRPHPAAPVPTPYPLGPLPRRDMTMLRNSLLPALRRLVSSGYYGLEVEGAEHVPRVGPAIYVGNHAGWFTVDTLIGAVAIADHVGHERLPWGAVHDRLLLTPHLGRFFEGLGGFPASWLREPTRIPSAMEVFSVYPEGVAGNCKSFWHAYQMRSWRTGFLRLAIARRAPIVPIAIIGGEESLPVLAPVGAFEKLVGSVLPFPACPVPLPTKWKFIFHRPVHIKVTRALQIAASDPAGRAVLQPIADEIADTVQRTLDRETCDSPLVRLAKPIRQSKRFIPYTK